MTSNRQFHTALVTWHDGETAPLLTVGVEDREVSPGRASWTHFGFVRLTHWREARPALEPRREVVLNVSAVPTLALGGSQKLKLEGEALHAHWLKQVRSTGTCLVGLNLASDPHLAWATVTV